MVKLLRPAEFKDTRQLPSEFIMLEIGRISIVSASIEDLMHSLYWKFAGISEEVGAIVTGDARATRLADDVVRVAKAAQVESAIVRDLQDIFSEFIQLAKTRNQFIHWIWSWNTDTHEDRIDPPGYKPKREGRYVTFDDVSKVADDLVWIEHRILAHFLTPKQLAASKAKYGLAGAPDAPTPWLEKMSPQETSQA